MDTLRVMESSITFDFGTDWPSGSQGSQTQRPLEVCLCQPWSIDQMELSSGKKAMVFKLPSHHSNKWQIQGTDLCSLAKLQLKKHVSFLNAGTKQNSPAMQRCSAEKCRSEAKP